jgi:hypothetical protein
MFELAHALLTGVGIGIGLMAILYTFMNWKSD